MTVEVGQQQQQPQLGCLARSVTDAEAPIVDAAELGERLVLVDDLYLKLTGVNRNSEIMSRAIRVVYYGLHIKSVRSNIRTKSSR